MCIHPQPFNESDEDAMPSLAVTAIPTPKSNAVPLRLWIGLAMSGKKQSVSVWSVLRVVAGRLALWQIEEGWTMDSDLVERCLQGDFRGVPL